MPVTMTPKGGRSTASRGRPFEAGPALPIARESANGQGRSADSFEGERSTPIPWRAALLIIAAGIALFVISDRRDHLLGQIAAPPLAAGALHGLWRGGFRKMFMLAAMVGVAYLAAVCWTPLDRLFQSTGGSGWTCVVIAVGALAALVIASWIVRSIRKNVILRRPLVRGLDRFLGVAVGAAEAAVLVLAVCWTAVEISPHARVVHDHQSTQVGSLRHQAAATLLRLNGESRAGVVGSLVEATNPIDRIPILREAIDNLNRTGEFDLGSLSPETTQRINELLNGTSAGDLAGLQELVEQYKQNNEARERAYRQLPSAAQGGR